MRMIIFVSGTKCLSPQLSRPASYERIVIINSQIMLINDWCYPSFKVLCLEWDTLLCTINCFCKSISELILYTRTPTPHTPTHIHSSYSAPTTTSTTYFLCIHGIPIVTGDRAYPLVCRTPSRFLYRKWRQILPPATWWTTTPISTIRSLGNPCPSRSTKSGYQRSFTLNEWPSKRKREPITTTSNSHSVINHILIIMLPIKFSLVSRWTLATRISDFIIYTSNLRMV